MALENEKEKLRIQQEYEESLKVSQSFLEGISKLIDNSAKGSKKLSDAEKKYNAGLKSILKDVSSREDILEKSSEAQEKFNKFASDGRRTEKGSIGSARQKNKLLQEGLAAELKTVDAISAADTAQKNLVDSISGTLDGITDTLGEIPIIGGALSSLASGPIENIKESITLAGQQFVVGFAKNMRDGMSGFAAMKASLASLKPLMMTLFNPVTIGIVALVAVLALAFKGFAALDGAASSFRKETGLLNSQTKGLSDNIASVTMQTAALGASAEDVAQAAAAFTNEFEGVVQPSKETLANIVALEKNFGVAAEGAVKVNKIFQSIGGLSEQASQALVSQTVEAAKLVGVAPDRVIKDLADNAETAAMFFQGSVGDLAKAAVEAARLGTSITQAAKVAEGLLDFENSITAELEASAMLGQSINFNKARELAAQGDILGAQQATLSELEKKVDLDNLNFFQLQSIAKASGMEVSELQNQLNLRKQFGPLNDEQKAALEQLKSAGNDITDISKEQLEAETAKVIEQREIQSQLDDIKNKFGAVGTQLTLAFAPLMESIIPALEVVADTLSYFGTLFSDIFNYFGKFGEMIGPVGKGLKALASVAIILGAYLAYGALAAIPFVGPVLGFAAAAAVLAAGFGVLSSIPTADDMISTGGGAAGYGSRVLTGPEGSIALNNQDDVVAGTNLMGGGGGGAVVSAIEKLGADIRALQVIVNLDGRKVTEGVSKVVSRNQSNNYGVTV